ncbi:MAG TPA: tyrosine-type recombinase/integrase, partial [Candidatus Thermoplasmatota archaeon]|nr:tyrosine-type recombinase/integrase [Candidatus Thermoplasmatota archaeon]
MQYTAITRTVQKWAARAGLSGKHVTPHLLRHTLPTHLAFAGMDPRSIQEIMGHADERTTMVYIHLMKGRLKEQYDRYVPDF